MSEAVLRPDGRVVLVSGASRGIGLAIARRLLADGYAVSAGARDPSAALAAIGEAQPGRLHAARFEAKDARTAERWVAEAAERFGRIDVLVNNVGILRQVTFAEGADEALDEMWGVNVMAPFRLIRAALPWLRKSGCGRIVNIASTDGKRYRDATVSVGYAMTKHAVMALTHAAKFAAWDDGVRATAICPGAVATNLLDGIPGVTPGPNRLRPETVAHAVSFVLSLPNNASVAELPMNPRLESTL